MHRRDVRDELPLDPPDREKIRQDGQHSRRARRKRQGSRNQGALGARLEDQRPGSRRRAFRGLFVRSWHPADQLQKTVDHLFEKPVSRHAGEARRPFPGHPRGHLMRTSSGAKSLFALPGRGVSPPPLLPIQSSTARFGVLRPGPRPITSVIRLGGKHEEYLKNYDSVASAAVYHARHAMPYENDLGIFIARGRHTPIEKAWPDIKHFE